MTPFKHILVATDFSPTAQRAVEMAITLALEGQGTLTLVHVTEIPVYAYDGMVGSPIDLLTPIQDAARQALDNAIVKLRERIPGATAVMRLGVCADEITAVADETHADLVVIGTHGRRGVSRLLLGSVAEKVVRMSQVPVLTVRGAPERAG